MELTGSKFYRILAPRPVVLVSTVNRGGVSNAAPFSFVMPVSVDPPLVAIASQPAHDTVKNIEETGEFVINIAPEEIIGQLWACSKKYPEGVSEIKETGLTEMLSKEVRAPRIKECIGWFECKVEFRQEAGDHVVIIGRVLKVEVKDDYWADEEFKVLKARSLLHLSGKSFAIASEVKTIQE